MKLITRDTDYAVRVLCCLACNQETRFTVDDLVECLEVPKPFTRKILQVLNKKGLLKSFKGKGGGFRLELHPGEISILDIMSIFQGNIEITECTFKKKVCKYIKSCSLRKRLNELGDHMMSELKTITIESLLTKEGKKRWQGVK